jgi:hypothetical protein
MQTSQGGDMRNVLWGAAALVCLSVYPISATAMTRAEARAAAERVAMLHDKDLAGSLSEFKQDFPEEYEKTIDLMAAAYLKGNEHDAIVAGREYLVRATYAQIGNIANAPDEALLRLVQAQQTLFATLARAQPELCLQAARGPIQPDTVHDPDVAKVLGGVGIEQLHAARAGIDHPVVRGPATQDDFAALRQAFYAAGGTLQDLQTAASLGQGGNADPDTACRENLLMAQATIALPPEARDRVIAMADLKFKELTEKRTLHR